MSCLGCGYPLPLGEIKCPRCHYRPKQEKAPSGVPVLLKTHRRMFIGVTASCLIVAGCLLAPTLLRAYREAQVNARARAIFVQADGPCRDGQDAPCQSSIRALRAIRDHSDAAFLLGDLRVSNYLLGLPSGTALKERWRQDQFSEAELTAMGNEAYRHRLIVFRSFWMYANVKHNQITVPTLAINNDVKHF